MEESRYHKDVSSLCRKISLKINKKRDSLLRGNDIKKTPSEERVSYVMRWKRD